MEFNEKMNSPEEYIEHYGVKGMKWGVRRTPEQLGHRRTDTKVTRQVKNDYNNMSDSEFFRKHAVSKKRYAKRVEKYGDPYKRRVQKNPRLVEADRKMRADLFAKEAAKKARKQEKANRPGFAQRRAENITISRIKTHESFRDGKGVVARLLTAPDRYTWGGKGRFESYHNMRIDQLNNSLSQIQDGKKIVTTNLLGPRYTNKKS